MAFTPAEEDRLRALLQQDTSLITLAQNEPAIIQELGAQDVTIQDLQLANSLLPTDKIIGRFGSEDKVSLLSALADFLKTPQGLALGSAAYKDIGIGEGNIPDMSMFLSGGIGRNMWFKMPNGLIVQTIDCSVSGTGQYGFNLPTAFPRMPLSASITPVDSVGDITISPTYVFNNLDQIIIYNYVGGGNTMYATVVGI